MVDEWVNAVAAISGRNFLLKGFPFLFQSLYCDSDATYKYLYLFTVAGGTPESVNPTPESVNPSVVDEEEGLPSPPLDEGALFATQTTMELSQVYRLVGYYGD